MQNVKCTEFDMSSDDLTACELTGTRCLLLCHNNRVSAVIAKQYFTAFL